MHSMNDMTWTPLNDKWDQYGQTVISATRTGVAGDPELAEEITWPRDLFFGPEEKEDVINFVNTRLVELAQTAQSQSVTVEHIGGYLFRTLIAGIMWERERIG